MCLVVVRWNIPWMIHILVRTCYWSYLLFYWDLLWPSASGICFMKLVYQHSLHTSHNHILCSSLPYYQLLFESLFIKMGITILAYKFCFVGYHFSSLFFQSVFFVEMLLFLADFLLVLKALKEQPSLDMSWDTKLLRNVDYISILVCSTISPLLLWWGLIYFHTHVSCAGAQGSSF